MPPSSDDAASQCLSDVDISSISDRTILENFSDQEARLVCLVCYKIFGPEEYATFRSHVTNHKRSALSKVRLRQSHRYVVSAVLLYRIDCFMLQYLRKFREIPRSGACWP